MGPRHSQVRLRAHGREKKRKTKRVEAGKLPQKARAAVRQLICEQAATLAITMCLQLEHKIVN